MSFNLIFETIDGNFVNFPVQTPTDLTMKVINSPHPNRPEDVVVEYVTDWLKDWEYNQETIDDIATRIRFLLNDRSLALTYI